MQAPSLTVLNERLSEVNCLIRVCHSRRARRARRFEEESTALLRGALVLLSSHIEGFFEELVRDVIDAVDLNAPTPSCIPTDIRIRQVLGKKAKWNTNDPEVRWKIVRRAANSPLFDDDRHHVAGNLDASFHIDGFSNPGTNEIKDLFRTIGIKDCWEKFHAIEPRVAYKTEIDSIVSRRNQVAHGDMNAIITELDITSYANNFKHTATVFSRIAYEHITEHLPNFRWPS